MTCDYLIERSKYTFDNCSRQARVKLTIAPRGTASAKRVIEHRCKQHAEPGSTALSGTIVTAREVL